MELKELYNLKLLDYKNNGVKEHPANLLAMLLLSERDKFEPIAVSEKEFYSTYKKEIDTKIEKVVKDFEITNEEIAKYIEDNGVSTGDFEYDKIWFVFCEGFGAMHWGLMYRPEKSPEEIYSEVFHVNLDNVSLPPIITDKIISNGRCIPAEDAINDVTPIDWSDDVLEGKHKGKVLIIFQKEKNNKIK